MRYPFKTKPYAHQVEGMRFAFSQFRQGLGAALLMEPRTGKTKISIDVASALVLKGRIRKVLVICPNRVMGTWIRELHTHCPVVFEAIVWDAKERRKGAIRQPDGHVDMQVLVTNFETFGTPGKRLPSGGRSRSTGRFKNRALIDKWIGNDEVLIVVDESHKLKNPSGKASNMIVGMRRFFTYQLILTGTPITKARRAPDIYMQWRMINPSRFLEWGATYEDFRTHVGRWITKNGFPQWVGAIDEGIEDLQRGIHQDGIVIRRDDCFDLPDAFPDRLVSIKLTTSATHYDEMAEDMLTQLRSGEIAEASIPLVVNLRLSQITSGYVGVLVPHPTKPDRQISRAFPVGTEKIDALKELLVEDCIEKDEPTIVVARWKHDLNAIDKLCETLGIPHWSIRGGMTRSATDDALRRFKLAAGSASVIIVQPQAGGVGLDMSTASQTIWVSLTSSWVDYKQMRDRNALASKGVQHTFLLAEGTIDEIMYQTLIDDGNFAKRIMRKPEAILRRSGSRR
jgi:SNF2 family DNA or RNA helicase